MKKKEWRKFIWCAAAAFALTGCQQAGPAEPQKGTAVETEDMAVVSSSVLLPSERVV